MFAHILQLTRFATTGAAAALTHYSVAMLLFQKHVALQYANLLAFLVAYWVSYFGHRIFTFKAQHLDHRQTLPKFTLVAGLGFLFNESFLLLSNLYFNVPVSTLVCIAIVLTSVVTFLLNRFLHFNIKDCVCSNGFVIPNFYYFFTVLVTSSFLDKTFICT